MEVNPSQMCRERFGGTTARGHPVGNFSLSPWVTRPHGVADTAPQAPLTFGLTGCSSHIPSWLGIVPLLVPFLTWWPWLVQDPGWAF